jgi:Galactose-3-O-sulfotransferase
VHIPKTAGTTVRTIFLHAYPRSAIRNSGNALRDPESSRRRVARLAQSTGGAVRVVVGHTPYGLHKAHMPADALYVTLLRDPVDQMLSSYHFLLPPGRQSPQCLPAREGPRILPLPPEETSLAEMLERGVYLLDNLATRMLADRETPFGELGPEDLQQAKDNLARFAVVGITERFDESIVLMQRALALGAVPYASQKVNSARPSLQAISAAERTLIEEHNQFDLELYSHARDLFDERLAAAGELAAEVRELRRISSGRDRPDAQLLSETRRRRGSRQAEPDTTSPPVIFVHVPKTGGSTAGSVVRRAYARKWARSTGNAFENPDTSRVRVQRLAAARGMRAISGHVPYGLLRAHFGDAPRYATILREPVDRTLSHYYWLTSVADGAHTFATRAGPRQLANPTRETSVEEMLERGLYLLDNVATRLLCNRDSPYGELSSDHLEDAKRNLRERFDLVGLTERLPESIVLLERMLGLELVPFTSEKINRSRPRVDDAPEGQRAVIEEYNRYDLELYSLGKELFEQKLAAAHGLEEEAEKLRWISEPSAEGLLPSLTVNGEQGGNGPVLEEVRRLEQVVADLRAQTGVEASELRAHIRELERRLEQLESSPPGPPEEAAPKSPKAERATEKRRARAARRGRDRHL